MNTQTLKRLSGALLVLVVLWVGLSFARHERRDTEGRFALATFTPKAVDRALIITGADTIKLVRQDTGWTVGGYRANGAYVDAMLNVLSDTTATSELVAESAASHARLGLDSATAHRLVVMQGARPLAALLVGGQGGTYGTSYVRKPGDNASWQLQGTLSQIANRSLDDWRDKTIVHLDPDSVGAIDMQRGKKTWRLTRADSGAWTMGAAAGDSSAVAAVLNQFRTLQASSFASATQADSANFARPDRSVRLTSRSGVPLVSLVMDSTAGGFWVRRAGDSVTYKLDSWLANQVVPVDSTLRKRKD
jgi:Domain of unknown function (DUF4340)